MAAPAGFISPEAYLAHWQGHRALTRRVIDAFPEDDLFSFSVGGMRPFGEMVRELLGMAVPMVEGAITEEWKEYAVSSGTSKAELLRQWDESTTQLDRLWKEIPEARFHERTTAFGQYEDTLYGLFLYVIDNEIHHRGQGYVYLRALEIEPPAFWER